MKTISKLSEIAIIICSHGSNNEKFKRDFNTFISKIKKKFSRYKVFYCFIEINSPSIEECIKLISKKYNKIIFVPTLLFKGKHYTEDIIGKIKKLVKRHNIELLITQNIILNSELIFFSFEEIKKKIRLTKNNLLITISSTSSNNRVKHDLRKYTLRLSENLRIKSYTSGFFGDENNIYKKIDKKILDENTSNIILNPLFLFDGFLYQSTKKRFQSKYKDKLLVTQPILQNKGMVRTFIEKINEKILLLK